MRDLIDECGEDLSSLGYKCKEEGTFGLKFCTMEVSSKEQEEKTGFERGEYFVLNCAELPLGESDCLNFVSGKVEKVIKNLLKKFALSHKSRFLIVGLGNPQILADSLGPQVVNFVRLKNYEKSNNIFKFAPNIFVNTGINAVEVVGMLAMCLGVDCVIIVDCLATESIDRLGCSIQINTAGITPGSAINNYGKQIGQSTIGLPCISIGVPFMFFGENLKNKQILLTPKDIHQNIEDVAMVIAQAINGVLKV